MKKSLPAIIVKNRRKKIKKFAQKYSLTPAKLADYFQVPIKVIEKDLESMKNLQFIGKEEFDAEKKKNDLLLKLTKKNGDSYISSYDWAHHGFWTAPIHYGDDCRDHFLNIQDEERRKKLQKACSMLRFGYTMTDVRLICELGLKDFELLKKYVGQTTDSFRLWALEQYRKGRVDAATIKDAVGASKHRLIRGKTYQYDREKKESDVGEKEYTKKEIYDKWCKGGITQEELAKGYGICRGTVSNWIREMKTKENDDIEHLKNRRNTSKKGREKSVSDEAERRKNSIEKLQPLIDEGASINRMKTYSGLADKTIKKYMKEDGIYEEYLKRRK